jgi:hypothetical protein
VDHLPDRLLADTGIDPTTRERIGAARAKTCDARAAAGHRAKLLKPWGGAPGAAPRPHPNTGKEHANVWVTSQFWPRADLRTSASRACHPLNGTVGTAVEPEPFAFRISRDSEVDAFFGDVDGDGAVGRSDIFATIEVLDDGRTISFSDGLIPAGGLFTDFNLAATTDGEPFLAPIDAQFDGVPAPVPLPATWALLAGPLAGLAGWCRRGRGARLCPGAGDRPRPEAGRGGSGAGCNYGATKLFRFSAGGRGVRSARRA